MLGAGSTTFRAARSRRRWSRAARASSYMLGLAAGSTAGSWSMRTTVLATREYAQDPLTRRSAGRLTQRVPADLRIHRDRPPDDVRRSVPRLSGRRAARQALGVLPGRRA